MQKFFTILFIVLAGNFKSFGQDKKAIDQLNQTMVALGGADLVNSIKSVRWVAQGHEYSIEQSDRPEGPYLVNYFSAASTKNISKGKCLYILNPKGAPIASQPYSTQIIVDGNRAAMRMRGMHFPIYQENDEQLALAPEVVVPLALKGNPLFMKDTVFQKVEHSIIAFKWRNYPVRLLINKSTNLITALEIERPITGNLAHIWGDVKRMFVYSLWTLEENGLHYPRQTDVFVNGYYPLRTVRIDSIYFNVPTPGVDTLTIGETAIAQMKKMDAMGQNPFEYPILKAAKEIRNGIYFIEGSWNSTFVKTDAGIVVLETPITSVYSKAVLSEVKKTLPRDKVIAAISTSDAWPHFGGVREYVANKIPVYILDINESIVRSVLNAKFTTRPDSLQKVKAKVKADLRKISTRTKIGEGSNRMEVIPLRSESGERMMMIYFPEYKLLYTSDLIQRNKRTREFFMAQYLSEVADAVKRENLVVDNIFGMHIGEMPYNDIVVELLKYKSKL